MGYGVVMRKHCYTHLSAEDRETLSLGLTHGHSLRTMARILGRAPSTVSREYARNTTRGCLYRACTVSADGISPKITELRSPLNTESQCPFTAHHDGGGTDAAKGGLHDDSRIGSTRALSL